MEADTFNLKPETIFKICPQCGGRWPAERSRCLACGASLAEAGPGAAEGGGEEEIDWSWLDATAPQAGRAEPAGEPGRLWGSCLDIVSGLLFLAGGYNLLAAAFALVAITSPAASDVASRFLWSCLLAALCLGLGFWLRRKARQVNG
ncbi:MAG: hypothetical protein JW850_03425 [Thermoflexales bacterium]|nr:hypothetical protein [Thermoflexales bacterium]